MWVGKVLANFAHLGDVGIHKFVPISVQKTNGPIVWASILFKLNLMKEGKLQFYEIFENKTKIRAS